MKEKHDEAHMAGLAQMFLNALEHRRSGNLEKASDAMREILKREPRLAEPRLELASMLLEGGLHEEAATHAEEAISILEGNGQWTDEIPENVLQSHAWSLLGAALQRQADADEIVFGDPDTWKALMERSKKAFKRAETLDPHNDHASSWAFGLELKPSDELH